MLSYLIVYFKILDEYVKNTHASTHTLYTLEIDQIFKVFFL